MTGTGFEPGPFNTALTVWPDGADPGPLPVPATQDDDGGKPRIPPHRIHEACRLLAEAELTRAQIARRFGITRSAVSQFAKRHRDRIEQIRADLDNEFAGLWITRKANRLAGYEADFELAASHRNASHHEWVKARTQILHAVAEELGDLPSRNGTAVIIPVVHVLEAVDLEKLR